MLIAAIVWVIFILSEVYLSFQNPSHVLNQADLSLGYKILLLGSDYFLSGLGIFFVAYIFYFLLKQDWLKGLVRSTVKLILFLVVFVFSLFFILDWALFYDYKAFINMNILKLIVYDFSQMFSHAWSIDPAKTVMVILFPLIFVFILWVLSEKKILRMQKIMQVRLMRLIYPLFILLFLTFGLALFFYFDAGNGFANKFRSNFKTRTGPTASLLSELWLDPFLSYSEQFFDESANYRVASYFGEILDKKEIQKKGILNASRFPIVERPIISLEDYAQTLNLSKIKRFNVILILVESLRPDQLKAFGGSRLVMPFLESLTDSAYSFTNTFAQASNSSYADLCPLSSHYPLRSRQYNLYPKHIPYPRVLIYDVLKSLGYKTAIISSQNERWGAMLNYLNTGYLDKILHAGNYTGQRYAANELASINAQGKIDDYHTVQEAINWIGQINSKDSFFLYMNLQNSHVPYRVPDGFPRKFSPERLDFVIGFNNYPKEKSSLVKDVYADSLRYVDAQIERFFSYLKERNLLDKTIFIVTGDTGQAFYEHGFAGHSNKLYNEVIKVPLIVKVPGVEKGIQDNRLAQHIDIPPSVLSLLGIEEHPSFQGVSLFDPLEEGEAAVYSIVQSYALQYAIIKRDWKLIFDVGEWEYFLYNLRSDPNELLNLRDREPGILKELSEQLTFWRFKQLEYYADPDRYLNYYPPFYKHLK